MALLLYIFSGILNNICEFYGYYKISGEKINFKSKKVYLLYVIQTILIILNYTFTTNVFKVLFTFLIMLLICRLLFLEKRFDECFIITFICEVITIIAEFCFMFLMSVLTKVNNNILIQTFQGTLLTNTMVCSIMIIILCTKIPTNIYKKMKKLVENFHLSKIIIFLSFVIFCASILFYISYYNQNEFFTLLVNFIISTIYFTIVIMVLVEKSKYNKINIKYQGILNDLKEYELMLNEYRILNHENKNQLYSIKGMTKNKKVNAYIDELLNDESNENELILKKCLFIPSGGLRGLIYSKLLYMKNNEINYSLNINKKISSKEVSNISTKTMIDVYKIIGVYLDNAIEAVSNLDEKLVSITLYYKDHLYIEISNNIKGRVDVNKLDKAGYSTKGTNRGYGLSLVNRILKKNKSLSNKREISKNQFKQILEIK